MGKRDSNRKTEGVKKSEQIENDKCSRKTVDEDMKGERRVQLYELLKEACARSLTTFKQMTVKKHSLRSVRQCTMSHVNVFNFSSCFFRSWHL